MQDVSDQAVGVGIIRGVRPDQQLVKVKLKNELMVNCKIKSEQFIAGKILFY